MELLLNHRMRTTAQQFVFPFLIILFLEKDFQRLLPGRKACRNHTCDSRGPASIMSNSLVLHLYPDLQLQLSKIGHIFRYGEPAALHTKPKPVAVPKGTFQ